MQRTTVGKEVLRGARLAQRLDEAGAGDPTVQERLRKLTLNPVSAQEQRGLAQDSGTGGPQPGYLLAVGQKSQAAGAQGLEAQEPAAQALEKEGPRVTRAVEPQ